MSLPGKLKVDLNEEKVVWIHIWYKDCKKKGEWVLYYENGQLYHKGELNNDIKVGEWVYYYNNGQLEKKGKYKDGNRVGEWFFYKKDGTIDQKIAY